MSADTVRQSMEASMRQRKEKKSFTEVRIQGSTRGILSMAQQSEVRPRPLYREVCRSCGTTPWMGDQLVARQEEVQDDENWVSGN
jgi:hypothetical protein